jgi:hypothetical protein
MMDDKYKYVAKNVDKLSDKTIEGMTNKEYKSLIEEIEKVIGK